MTPEESKDKTISSSPSTAVSQSISLVDSVIEQFDAKATSLDPDMRELGRDLIRYVGTTVFPRTKTINKKFFEGALEELDRMISEQLDEVLHNDQFQKLESAWTGLRWMIERTDFRSNIRIDLINASKDDLRKDFEDAIGDVTTTGLYTHIYTSQYGMANGKPYGAMIVNYEFSQSAPDVELLGRLAEVANMAHAPVIGAVSEELFGPKGFEHLTDNKYSVNDALNGKAYAKWNGLREAENSKYIGLALPHFLLRLPYSVKDNPTKGFQYSERVGGDRKKYLWGNAAFTFASRLTEAFKKNRWCWRVVGEESGGMISDLKMHVFEENGEQTQKPPTEVAISFRKENELREAGLIPVLWLQEKDQSVIYHAPSFKLPLKYPDTEEGNKKEADESIRCRLPYVFILTRFAHYIKRLQTRYIGMATSKAQIQKDMEEWLRQYQNDTDNPMPNTLGKTPLRRASVHVQEDPRKPGWFLVNFEMIPHTLAEGFSTTLSLVTKTEVKKA